MLIKVAALRRWAFAILQHAGSADTEAEWVSDHLVRANLAGHDSHGVGMLPAYIRNLQAGLLNANTPVKLVKDDGAILVFDGQWGYGQRVTREAMEIAIQRCRDTGVVAFALRQAHHMGRIGTYGEQSIAAGLASIHFVNVTDHDPLVAPFGGADGRFVTNPICLAMPGTMQSEPVLLDMATSRIAAGKVRVAMNKGVAVADGILIDAQGRPTNDPRQLFHPPKGALLPFGEHKGSGLALFCELLAGALGGGGTIQPGNTRKHSIINSMLGIILDPKRFVDLAWMQAEVDALLNYVKASPPADPEKPVMVAGDPERKAAAMRGRDGIDIDPTTCEELLAAGEKVGLPRAAAPAMASGDG